MTNRVNHNHDHKSPHNCDSGHGYNLVLVGVNHHRGTTSENQEVCTQNLCNYLQYQNKLVNQIFNINYQYQIKQLYIIFVIILITKDCCLVGQFYVLYKPLTVAFIKRASISSSLQEKIEHIIMYIEDISLCSVGMIKVVEKKRKTRMYLLYKRQPVWRILNALLVHIILYTQGHSICSGHFSHNSIKILSDR